MIMISFSSRYDKMKGVLESSKMGGGGGYDVRWYSVSKLWSPWYKIVSLEVFLIFSAGHCNSANISVILLSQWF